MDDTAQPAESLRTDTVLEYLEATQGARCFSCGADVCGHEAVICLAIGFKNSPRCLSCLATGLARERSELRDHVSVYIDHHECLRAGWAWASRQEGFDSPSLPACLWEAEQKVAAVADHGNGHAEQHASHALSADAEWNAGDLGCGDLVLELRLRLQPMKSGEILKLTACDPGAPEDLPAWCRLTGHALLLAQHPEYWIQRKEG
ncbi:MAG TPA: sulfurtransferase TusA family protein [archaeon]|nr:sulfurtransferase TusA family protein [archaeon]